jgi:undecaprenyl diphosphate synthase
VIRWLYERLLRHDLEKLPRQICFMITGEDMVAAPEKVFEVSGWCREIGLGDATFHISTDEPDEVTPYLPALREVAKIARLRLHVGDRVETTGEGMCVTIAVGKSGREEIAECIRKIAIEDIPPEEIDEETIEHHLTYHCAPDLVIKTGGSHLTDFLIWQSVYAEFFFSDVNWKWFRKIDFLRALRDFQARARRFGA